MTTLQGPRLQPRGDLHIDLVQPDRPGRQSREGDFRGAGPSIVTFTGGTTDAGGFDGERSPAFTAGLTAPIPTKYKTTVSPDFAGCAASTAEKSLWYAISVPSGNDNTPGATGTMSTFCGSVN